MKESYSEYIHNLFNVIESMDPLISKQKGIENTKEPLYVNYLDIGEPCYDTFEEV